MWIPFKAHFAKRRMIREAAVEVKPGSLLDELQRTIDIFDPALVADTPAANWRQVKFHSLHNDIYYLLWAVSNSATSAKFLETPDVEVTKSRKLLVNLKPNNLEAYLVDVEGNMADVRETFNKLKESTQHLIRMVKNHEGKESDTDYFDYYSRQNTNLFEELTVILKLYIDASKN